METLENHGDDREDRFLFLNSFGTVPYPQPFPESLSRWCSGFPFLLGGGIGWKTILICQRRQVTFCGKQQQQQPCGSSKLRSAALKQQQQSTRLAAVPGKPSDF